MAQTVFLEFLELKEGMEWQDNQEFLGSRVIKDRKAFKVFLVQLDIKGTRVTKETRACKDFQCLVKKVIMECLVSLVYQEKEKRVCLVCLASRVDLDYLVLWVAWAARVYLACKELQDRKENLGYLV